MNKRAYQHAHCLRLLLLVSLGPNGNFSDDSLFSLVRLPKCLGEAHSSNDSSDDQEGHNVWDHGDELPGNGLASWEISNPRRCALEQTEDKPTEERQQRV